MKWFMPNMKFNPHPAPQNEPRLYARDVYDPAIDQVVQALAAAAGKTKEVQALVAYFSTVVADCSAGARTFYLRSALEELGL